MPQLETNHLLLNDDLTVHAHELRKYLISVDDTSSAMLLGQKPVAIISGNNLPDGAITEYDIENSGFEHFAKGDTLIIIDPITMTEVEEVTCSTDLTSTDTVIAFNSFTPTKFVYDKFIVALDSRQKISTNSIQIGGGNARSFEMNLWCRTTNTTITECTTDGLTGSGGDNKILVPLDCAMTCHFEYTIKQESSAYYYSMQRKATFVNNGGLTTMPNPVLTPIADYGSASLVGVVATITANDPDGCIKVEFTGKMLTNLNCSVNVKCCISKYE